RLNVDDAIKKIFSVSVKLLKRILPFVIILFVFAEEALVLLYGKFGESAPIFRIYLVIVLIHFLFADVLLLTFGKSNWIAIVAFFECGVNIFLSIYLLNIFGLNGPAVSTLISKLITVALCYFITFNY